MNGNKTKTKKRKKKKQEKNHGQRMERWFINLNETATGNRYVAAYERSDVQNE